MVTISTDITLTLDGVTPINVNGVDAFIWTGQWLDGLFLEPGASGVIVTLNLVADWAGGVIRTSGSLGTILSDDPAAGYRDLDGIFLAGGVDTVSLTRMNVESISTRGGNDVIDINGGWVGWLLAGDGDDTITTSGYSWVNTLDLGTENNSVTILATASGVDSIGARGGMDTVHAYADVDLITTRGGNDRVETSGNWVDMIETGTGDDVVVADGSVRTINAGDGVDDVSSTAGTWIHLINGADGDDLLQISGECDLIDGGAGNDTIVTGDDRIGTIDAAAGSDSVTLGGGPTVFVDLGHDADTLIVGVQNDPAFRIIAGGGEGVTTSGDVDRDTVDFTAFTAGLRVSLTAEVARSTQGFLTLIGFENVIGGQGDDVLTGDAQDNILRGAGGSDLLLGGRGQDRLYGGAGADTFRFYDIDRRLDLVCDFRQSQGDRIDLRAIDANAALRGDQAFQFIDTAGFHGRAGELRVVEGSGWVRLSGDMNGDRVADMHILLPTNSPLDLTAADFLL